MTFAWELVKFRAICHTSGRNGPEQELERLAFMDPFRSAFNRVHREGVPFVLIAFALAALSMVFISEVLGWILIVLGLYIVYFFRDPVRMTPILDTALVSPADGVVSKIEQAVPPVELEMGEGARTRISIFLSVLNVHVNRVPSDGTITKLNYIPGKFINATLDKASDENERQLVRLDRADGRSVAFVQIAGLIARRIVCNLEVGQTVEAGERFGIIRFGSRMDVYCPEGMEPVIAVGQTVVGGETVIADDKPSHKNIQGRAS
nr:phosphatidylserine decarboxylase [Iodidimonas muriae]